MGNFVFVIHRPARQVLASGQRTFIGGPGGSASWGGITGTLADQTDLQAALDSKASTAQGAMADSAVQPGTLTTALDSKVDTDGVKVLSDENYTGAEKTKLAGLEAQHYRGTYTNLTALQSAVPAGVAGDYADVDAGAADPVLRYIWDSSDSEWVAQAGSADPITAAQVKTLYESNADTNGYSDAEKAKLSAIAAGATANADTDSLAEGATNKWFTVARVLATVLTGLSVATSGTIVSTDSVLAAFGKLQKQITDLTTSVATKITNPMTAAADLIVGGASGAPARLAKGTALQVLRVNAGATALEYADAAAGASFAPVITEATTARTLGLTGVGAYIRHTNASASTVTVAPQASVAWAADTEIHIRRAAAGNLTLTPGAGVTLNPPSGGTLVMTNAMSVTLKRVASDVWDVIGQTVAV